MAKRSKKRYGAVAKRSKKRQGGQVFEVRITKGKVGFPKGAVWKRLCYRKMADAAKHDLLTRDGVKAKVVAVKSNECSSGSLGRRRGFGDPPGIHHNRRIDAERASDRYLDLAEEALEGRGDCGMALNRLKASSLFLGQAGCHSNSGGGNIHQALYNHGAKVWGKFNKVCIKKAR